MKLRLDIHFSLVAQQVKDFRWVSIALNINDDNHRKRCRFSKLWYSRVSHGDNITVISIHNLRAKPWSIGLFWIGYSNKWFPGGLGLLATSRIEILIEHLPVLIFWGFPHGVSASGSQKRDVARYCYILKWATVPSRAKFSSIYQNNSNTLFVR